MEKLERVLTAEDDARTTLVDARSEAAAIREAGTGDARRIEAEAVEASRIAVASERETVLAKAHAEADALTAEAAGARERSLAAARERLDDTVRRIAASLEG
jgi:vacuolar-type H+-ATPase subunit H